MNTPVRINRFTLEEGNYYVWVTPVHGGQTMKIKVTRVVYEAILEENSSGITSKLYLDGHMLMCVVGVYDIEGNS